MVAAKKAILKSNPSFLTLSHSLVLGPFWRRVPVWDTEGGATAQHASDCGKDVVEFYQKPTPIMVSANRQSAGDEIVR